MTLHYFLNDVNDIESTQSLNSESACSLNNRITGSRLLISSLPGWALRMHVESLGKPRDVNKCSQSLACLVNLISNLRHSPSIPYNLEQLSFWIL